jgi:hypothetical protein
MAGNFSGIVAAHTVGDYKKRIELPRVGCARFKEQSNDSVFVELSDAPHMRGGDGFHAVITASLS